MSVIPSQCTSARHSILSIDDHYREFFTRAENPLAYQRKVILIGLRRLRLTNNIQFAVLRGIIRSASPFATFCKA